MKTFSLVGIVACCITFVAHAQVIPSSRQVVWAPGSTVGVVGGIPWRTNNIIDVTQAPYNADKTGATPSTTAIQNAINAAADQGVVYCPAGVYDITGGLTINRDDVSLRGDGTNTILVGFINAGNEPNVTVYASPGFTIVKGSTMGSTNISLSTNQDQFGATWSVGDFFVVSSHVQSSDRTNWEVIGSIGGDSALSAKTDVAAAIKQWVYVTAVNNGTNLTVWPPLTWWFTNSPTEYPFSEIGFGADRARTGIGLENFTLIGTNGTLSSFTFAQILFQGVYNGWMTNIASIAGLSHDVWITSCANVQMTGCLVNGSRLSPGSNEGALLVDNLSGGLIENNIIEGGTPGLEWNDGVVGTAFFANLFTNNFAGNDDITMHKTHPVMDLFEQNVTSDFLLDGYFGSSSDLTFFRNRNNDTTALNRFSTYINVVGNVCGNAGTSYVYQPTSNNFPSLGSSGIFVIGFPNIGNDNWSDTSPPAPYNFPGSFSFDTGFFVTNGVWVITNFPNQNATNIVPGNFSSYPTNQYFTGAPSNQIYMVNYTFVGQDSVNTNAYFAIGTPTNITTTNLWFANTPTVSNNWRIYLEGALAWQHRYDTNVQTDILTGNAVCTNQSTFVTVWDNNGVQALPSSYLYTNASPPWWGTNHWPAIGPDASPQIGFIPAQERFLGLSIGIPVTNAIPTFLLF